ncbi:MAG: hypothetical protein Q9168_007128, partial [Polycauliona sp. 1 TL-2023]
RLQQYHPKPHSLNRIQHTQPHPQYSSRQRAHRGPAGPGDPDAHSGGGPEDLAPAGTTEADGGDGDDPAVVEGEAGEEEEDEGPDEDEEGEDEEDDGVGWGMLGGPEVLPVAAEGGGEEIVLEEDGYEEPLVVLMVLV